MIREFFYLQKSDRKVVLTLLLVIVVALGVIFLTGDGEERSNGLLPADTVPEKVHRDSSKRYHYYPKKVYYRTKVVYRDTAFRRAMHKDFPESRDSLVSRYPVKIKEGEHIVLNTADTTALKTVPGIGSYFAKRIVQYGERLGGYVSVDQLDEIEGFPLDSKDFFVIQDATPQKLNVNTLSLNELKKHPYINFYQARAITDYRRLHGPLRSLNDLRLSRDFPPEAIARLAPYVEF